MLMGRGSSESLIFNKLSCFSALPSLRSIPYLLMFIMFCDHLGILLSFISYFISVFGESTGDLPPTIKTRPLMVAELRPLESSLWVLPQSKQVGRRAFVGRF